MGFSMWGCIEDVDGDGIRELSRQGRIPTRIRGS